MNLNLTILKDYLPPELQTRLYGEAQDKLVCSRPFLCEADTSVITGNTYLLRAELLPFITPVSGCSFICVGSPVPFNWQESGISLLQINGSSSFTSVFNAICHIYDFFDHWDFMLHKELEKQADYEIQDILRLGAELFKNQINVIDHSLSIIFETVWETDSHGKRKVHIDNTPHTMRPNMTESIKNVCNLERRISVPYISSLKDNNFRSYCNNLFPLGYFTGCISITETEHPFRDSDFSLADYFFSVFQIAFEKHLRSVSSTNTYENNVLQKLLRHQPLNPNEQKELILSDNEELYCFKLHETNKTSCMPKEYMHAALYSFVPQILTSTIYHQHIIGLLKIPKQEGSSRTFLSFKDMLERMNYCAGISNSFSRLEQLDECLIQADYSLQNSTQTLNFFTNNIVSFLLHECTTRISRELLTTEALRRVIAYDARKNTEYLHTLQVYLENEMNITPTAQALFIHRSSLIKRLNKLTDLLQDNLSDPKTKLYYRLWFELKQ